MVTGKLNNSLRAIVLTGVLTFFVASTNAASAGASDDQSKDRSPVALPAQPAQPAKDERDRMRDEFIEQMSEDARERSLGEAPVFLESQLTEKERIRVSQLLKQIGENVDNDSVTDLSYVGTIDGAKDARLESARSAFVELKRMGRRVVPDLVASLNERKQPSYPVGEVISLLLTFHGQNTVMAFINAGKLNAAALETAENMLNYDNWKYEWFLPLFSSKISSARAFALSSLSGKFVYYWEEWEVQNGTQPIVNLLIKAARSDEDIGLRKLAIEALEKCHHVNENDLQDTAYSLSLLDALDRQEAIEGRTGARPGETIGQGGDHVNAWRAKQRPFRIAQNEQIVRTLGDILEHDDDPSLRRDAANQLRQCNEAIAEPFVMRGLHDPDAAVKEECVLFIMKRAVQNADGTKL